MDNQDTYQWLLEANGSVGIGTTSPVATLTVDGITRCYMLEILQAVTVGI